MRLINLTLPLSSDPAVHPLAGAARLVNCYADPQGDRAKSAWALISSEGLTSFATLTDGGGVRGMIALGASDFLAVGGRILFRVDSAAGVTQVGGIPSDGNVSMALNNVGEVAIVCDGLYFGYTGGVLTQLVDPDLPPPVSVCIIGGYFVFMIADGRMFASDLNAFGVTGLSYATTEQSPDKGVVAWVRGDDLLAGGQRSIEVWAVTGDEGFPFRKVSVVLDPLTQQSIGVLAPASAIDGLFVASDKTIKQLQGYSAITVSSQAVNRSIADDPSPENISATSWARGGHTFYAFSGTSWTWVLDTTTKLWHQRESHLGRRWRVSRVVQIGTSLIAGHYDAGTLYRLDANARDDAGDARVLRIQSAPVADFPYRLRHVRLDLDAVVGVGTIATPSPKVMVDWSDDGGVHWSSELHRSLGAAGQTQGQIRVNQLGSARSRTYRFSISDPVERVVIGAKVGIEPMGMV